MESEINTRDKNEIEGDNKVSNSKDVVDLCYDEST